MAEGYLCWRPHASPGFDGWVMLVREEFETEDQAIDSEKARLRSIGRVKRRRLEAGGVDVEQLQLTYECGLVYNPPDEDEERVWALEYFKERMLDYVADDDELLSRLLHHQAAVHGITPLEAHERARATAAPSPGAVGEASPGGSQVGEPADSPPALEPALAPPLAIGAGAKLEGKGRTPPAGASLIPSLARDVQTRRARG